MKRIIFLLALIAFVSAVAPSAGAQTRGFFGFSYGSPYYCNRLAYAYPVVVETYCPRHRFYRPYHPYFHRVTYRYRPYGRIVVRACY